MKVTPWFPANTHPKWRGLYERDWRGTDILPVEDRQVILDYWIPAPNPKDSLYPGVWFIPPEWTESTVKIPGHESSGTVVAVGERALHRCPWRSVEIAVDLRVLEQLSCVAQ